MLALATSRAAAFDLRSDAFGSGGTIPVEHTCDGADRSPPLAWRDPPANTASFALVCEDPDAPAGTWVHWVAYELPATARALPAGVPPTPTISGGGRQGVNDFRRPGWGGPCPPRGPAHRYVFTLYALDTVLGLEPGATRAALGKAIAGHVLGKAELTGQYARR
jgi:hypothetical protein